MMFYWHIHVLQLFLDPHLGSNFALAVIKIHNLGLPNYVTFLCMFLINRITKDGKPLSSLVHSRSSGLRVSTAAGSTAAMLSAGGLAMPILSRELQYMVREPISPGPVSPLMCGFVKSDEAMDITWFCKEGFLYIDGSHVVHSIQHGDTIKLSSGAPTLKVYLPSHLLTHDV